MQIQCGRNDQNFQISGHILKQSRKGQEKVLLLNKWWELRMKEMETGHLKKQYLSSLKFIFVSVSMLRPMPVAGVLDEPYSQLTPLSVVAVQAR
jgi:hypothetical protein